MSDEYDPTDLAAQEQAKEARQLTADVARQNEEDDIKWLMGSKRGRRIVWRLLDQAGVFRSSFSTNAAVMGFNEGCRNFGLRTLSQIHSLCPELYHPMVKEQSDGGDDAGRARKPKH